MRDLIASLPGKVVLLIVVFALVTGIAELIGTKNLGTSMTFGQIAFAITVVALMLKGGPPPADAPGADGSAP